jgi:hypothetical protein
MASGKRTVRGIHGIPQGYFIGRRQGGGLGAAELLSAAEVMGAAGVSGNGQSGQQVVGMPTINDGEILSRITGGAGLPVGNLLSAIIDHVQGSTQGSILYRNATGWVVLGPGSLGQYVKSGGPAANISWATLPASGSIATDSDVSLSGLANKDLLWYQTSDSKWHNTTLTALIDSILGATQGSIIYRNGTVWTVLVPGTSGTLLQTGGAAANVSWNTHLTDNGTTRFTLSYNSGTPTAPPTGTVLHLVPADSTNGLFVIDSYLANPGIDFRLSRGTAASPAAISSADQIGIFAGRAHDGTAYSNRQAGFALAASENWAVGAHGTEIQLFVTKNGTTTLVKEIVVANDGGVQLNTSTGVAPTGGSKGPGSINASDAAGSYYINGVVLLDALVGATQGAVMYRNAGGWTMLTPGTSGQFLQTKGAAQNPVWAAPSSAAGAGLWAPAMSATPTQASTGLNTWYNQLASSTVTDISTGVVVYAPSQANNNRISAIQKNSAGSGVAKQYIACIARTAHPNSYTGTYFGWSDGTKVHGMGFNGAGTSGIVVNHWSNATTYVAQDSSVQISFGTSGGGGAWFPPIWFQLIDDGTNIGFAYGYDGTSWLYVFSQARSAGYLGSTGYTKIIFGCNPYDALIYSTLLSYQEI